MLMRVERFELIIKLVLSQPPLPIGLHAQVDLNWYSREDSNLQDGRFELPMSARLHHASRCWCFRKDLNLQLHGSQPCASASCATTATNDDLVPAEGFEPTRLVPKTSASSRLGYAGMV